MLGHLTRVEKRSSDGGTLLQRIDYAYDALGNRIHRTVYDGSLTVVADQKFGYDGWDTALTSEPRASASGLAPDNSAFNVWADLNASDNSLQTRRLFGNSYDAEIARIGSAGTVAYYVQDRQNTVRYMLDGSGTVQATLVYDGYGNQTSNSNTSFTDRYGYTGRELEPYAPHLMYYRGDWLALDIGRWTAPDAWKQNANNLTVYCFNSPTNGRDPSGNEQFALGENALRVAKMNDRFKTIAVDLGVMNGSKEHLYYLIPTKQEEIERDYYKDVMRTASYNPGRREFAALLYRAGQKGAEVRIFKEWFDPNAKGTVYPNEEFNLKSLTDEQRRIVALMQAGIPAKGLDYVDEIIPEPQSAKSKNEVAFNYLPNLGIGFIRAAIRTKNDPMHIVHGMLEMLKRPLGATTEMVMYIATDPTGGTRHGEAVFYVVLAKGTVKVVQVGFKQIPLGNKTATAPKTGPTLWKNLGKTPVAQEMAAAETLGVRPGAIPSTCPSRLFSTF